MRAAAAWQPWRLRVYLAAYYAAGGVLGTYLPLYLERRGLTAAQIGVVTALAQGLRIVAPAGWGWLADHTLYRAAVLRVTTLAACLGFLPLLLPGGFGLVLGVTLVYQIFLSGQVPLAEAIAAMHLRGEPGAAGLYGRLRASGSIGFIVFVLSTGALLDRTGLAATPYIALGLLAATFVASCLVLDAPPAGEPHEPVSVRARLAEPRVRWFFLSVLLMIAAHGALYTYFSIYLAVLGYSKTQIGVFWVLGVLCEIGLFYTQGRLFRRFEQLRLVEASFLVAAVRFFLTAEFAQSAVVLVIAQLLHAMTFAVHHSASILAIQRWFPGRAAGRGQALYTSIGYGVGATLGSLIAAWLWSAVSPSAAFLSSSVAALLGWFAVRRARELDRAAGHSA
ncbi:MAG TPA: MFS transporter [Burkholderiaceae bacterium]|nr:MFS transporter [Burkholderiaceae bacterium]